MKRTLGTLMVLGGLTLAAPAAAQDPPAAAPDPAGAATSSQDPQEHGSLATGRPIVIQYMRPQDQRGVNVFETSKDPGAEYTGFRFDIGAGFTTQIQDLDHENTATPNLVNGTDTNQLVTIGRGANLPTANLYLHAQVARGIRVQLTSYLSSRHHNETWVKDGYIQIDESPIDFVPLQALMQVLTLKVGHMEVNYGDAHFRRSDNGNALWNPFVGNYILDAFTTEPGAEIYLKTKGIIAMGAVTSGELRPAVTNPTQKGFTYIGKLGIDRQVRPAVRVRVTGSLYTNDNQASNTLYSGDRAGSRYYWVMENTAATESAQFTSGLLNPGLRNEITAMQLNPFVKVRGLELFGVLERATGKASTETDRREWNHYALDVVYRFLPKEQAFVGARYNRAEGPLAAAPTTDVGARRVQLAGGWFVTPNILAKAEYVNQEYFGYPVTDIKNGGKFNGVILEGVVGF
jgi:hypothetical protein